MPSWWFGLVLGPLALAFVPHRHQKIHRILLLTRNGIEIEGIELSKDSSSQEHLHRTILHLQEQIPNFLRRPFVKSDLEVTYRDDLQVSLQGSTLTRTLEEALRLHQVVVLANAATTRQELQGRIGIVNKTQLLVDWETQGLSGRSRLELDTERKVQVHTIQKVVVQGVEQDAAAMGQFLTTSKQAVEAVQEIPLVNQFLSVSGPIFNQVRDEFLQTQTEVMTSTTEIPVFLVNGTKWEPVPPTHPGSNEWESQVATQSMLTTFCDDIIPTLINQSTPVQPYFTKMACLTATDGSVLLRGAHRVARFYEAMNLLRQRGQSRLQCHKVEVVSVEALHMQLRVHYRTTSPLPGTSKPLISSGVDEYILVKQDDSLLIEQIDQQTLRVDGLPASAPDPKWLIKTIARTIEAGQLPNDAMFTEWIASPSNQTTITAAVSKSDKAALATYRIMESLVKDLHLLLDPDTETREVKLPAVAYLAEDIRLVGLLDETLLRGRTSYARSLGLAFTSIRSALISNRIESVASPVIRVELSMKGTVKASAKVDWRLRTPGGLAEAASFPSVELEVMSEYIVSDSSCEVVEHKILETKVNGQKTPADVLASWVKGLGSDGIAGVWNGPLRSPPVSWMKALGLFTN